MPDRRRFAARGRGQMTAGAALRVLCVTPNVAVDRTLTVPGFAIGGVFRAAASSVVCGGKGVNVARVAARLGHRPVCAGMLAGHLGRLAADLAAAEGLPARWTWIAGETRVCLIVTDGSGSTVVNEPGPAVSDEAWDGLVHDVAEAAVGADLVCISGSLPPGIARGGFADLIAAARRPGSASGAAALPVWIDTHGEPLIEAVDARPFAIRINGYEAAGLLGTPVSDPSAALAAARQLRAENIAVVCISLGAAGAVLVTAEGAWQATPPLVTEVNPTGAGDAFLAALATAWRQGPLAALRHATGVAAADCLQPRAAAFSVDDRDRLAAATRIEPLW